jgi:hypothetical protein
MDMEFQSFTSNFQDNSNEKGFMFTFMCDLCREGYKTQFVEAKSSKKGKFLKGFGSVLGTAAQMTGKFNNVGSAIERGTGAISNNYQGMTAEWHKEHEEAFATAQNQAKGHFHRCPKCKRWTCDNDWNEQEGLCVEDAPRQNIEVAAAKAKKMVDDIGAKASSTQVFNGKIESKQTICPKCGKPSGEGKFCNNCGASLELIKCPKCGIQSAAGTKFCGECGTKFG